MKQYVCSICGYVYDETVDGPWEELPEDWKCPLCGADKSAFREKTEPAQPAGTLEKPHVEKELSAMEMSVICSNLARGCEKQYKEEEAGLFRELAEYFTAAVPAVSDPTVEKLAADLREDAENYAGVRATVDADGDRGAARVCVWGEKVTRMLSSLVNRYLTEGERMLESTSIWVCSVCGFVYIGDKAPELCPVCKVPAWKFEKVEGRV